MMTAQVDMTGFNRGVAALIAATGATARQVVEKETGELIKTLINITPPKDDAAKQKVEQNISTGIRRTFEQLGEHSNFEYQNAKTSSTGVKWYASNEKYLFGLAADKDMTKAGRRELLLVHYKSKNIAQSKGQGVASRRLIAPMNRATAQKAAIGLRVVTTKKQIDQLIKRTQKNVGRMKAGWLPAIRDGKIQIGGRYLPKKFVTRHATGARGRYDGSQLTNKEYPSFEIANYAKGIRSANEAYFVNAALKTRAKAMLDHVKWFTNGKKNLSDYLKVGKVFQIS